MENLDQIPTVETTISVEEFLAKGITSDTSEQDQIDWDFFQKGYEGFEKLIDNDMSIFQSYSIAHAFYSKHLNQYTWNRILKEMFQTKQRPMLHDHTKRVECLIDYKIQKSRERFDTIRYKTSIIEGQLSQYLNDDINFGEDKQELLEAMEYHVYEVRANILNESIKIPVNKIVEALRNCKYKLFIPYLLLRYGVNINEIPGILKTSELTKFINSNFRFCLQLQYEDDVEFENNCAWNPIVGDYRTSEIIGYFTTGFSSRIIGNVWIDPRFRGRGIATKIFEYIKNNIAKKEPYIVTTKNDNMKKIFKKLDFKYVGNTGSYIGDNYPNELKAKINSNYMEEVYVISNKPMENIDYYMLCNAKLGYEAVLYTTEILNYDSDEAVVNTFIQDGFQFIGYTKPSIYSNRYYNYYTEKDDVYPTMLFTHPESDSILEYPMFNGILISPDNHRAIMRKQNTLDFLVTPLNFDDTLDLHIGLKDGNGLVKSIQVIKNIYMNKVEIYKSLAITLQNGNNLPNPFLTKLISEQDLKTYELQSIGSGFLTLVHKQEPLITKTIEI